MGIIKTGGAKAACFLGLIFLLPAFVFTKGGENGIISA